MDRFPFRGRGAGDPLALARRSRPAAAVYDVACRQSLQPPPSHKDAAVLMTLSLAGVVGGYLAALVVTPLAGGILFGSSIVEPLELFLIVAELIAIPVILSRILLKTGVVGRLEPMRGAVVDWALSTLCGQPTARGTITLFWT